MIGEDCGTVPKLTGLAAIHKKSQPALDDQRKPQTKYRWLWMMKNRDEMLWCVYARSAFWSYNYRSCKENALQQEIHTPFNTTLRLDVEIYDSGCIHVVENLSVDDTNLGADEAAIQSNLNSWKKLYAESSSCRTA